MAPDDVEHDDRDHRAQVERAQRRDEPPEDPQERLAHVAQERHDGVPAAAVGQSPTEREEHRAQDVGDDQDRVDERQRLHVARDVAAGRGFNEH